MPNPSWRWLRVVWGGKQRKEPCATWLLFVWVYITQLRVMEVGLGARGNKTPHHKSWYHNPNPSPMINDPACHPEVKPWARVPRDAGQFFRIVADEGRTLSWRKQVPIRYYLIKFVHSSTYMGREYTTKHAVACQILTLCIVWNVVYCFAVGTQTASPLVWIRKIN